ncbi:MAG: LPS export ABC transporter periplasmic protein LptC [Gemmatimonadota bacterium]|nr:LPS export ABC transporter periplasmic protein LptC [Gemmatimonadota bacterium]
MSAPAPVGRSASRGLLAAALVAALAVACEEAPESSGSAQIPLGPDTLPPPDQVVEDGEHVITVEGVKKAVLIAEQLYFYNDTSTVVGDTIQVNFFGEGGEFVSMLTAVSGVINQRSQEMTARGSVDVRSDDSRIETEVLHYEPDADRIWSDQPTVINQRGNVIRGRGVESDPGLERIRIEGGSAVLRSEPDLGPEPDTTRAVEPRTDRQRAIEEAEAEARRRERQGPAEEEAGDDEAPAADTSPPSDPADNEGPSDDGP